MAAAVIPVAATAAPIHLLLHVYKATLRARRSTTRPRTPVRSRSLLCGLAFVLATVVAWVETLRPQRRRVAARRRLLGAVVIASTVVAVGRRRRRGHAR